VDSLSFSNILAIRINDPGKPVHSVPEDTIDVIKGEAVPRPWYFHVNFSVCVRLPTLQDFLQHLFDRIVQDILSRFDPARFPNEQERIGVANELGAVICLPSFSLQVLIFIVFLSPNNSDAA
jgi:hypothetical protein